MLRWRKGARRKPLVSTIHANLHNRCIWDQSEVMNSKLVLFFITFWYQSKYYFCIQTFSNVKTSCKSIGSWTQSKCSVCFWGWLTAGRPGREEVRDSPGLWRLSWERMGESILDEPANSNVVECSYNSEIRLSAKTVCREKALGRKGLTEDAMPL